MLVVHRSETTATLAHELGKVLGKPLEDPLSAEVIAVPAQGVERWLAQTLSKVLGVSEASGSADGVAGNIAFPSVQSLAAETISHYSHIDPATDPWRLKSLAWTLVEVMTRAVNEEADQPWTAILSRHLGKTANASYRARRRYSTALHFARMFRSYSDQRPSMLTQWALGHDVDGLGNPLAADQAWQAEMFRRARTRCGVASPAERLGGVCDLLRTDPDLSPLPARISIFGATRITETQLEIIGALAQHRDIHMWLPHPSPVLWDSISHQSRRHHSATTTLIPRSENATNPTHPLLAGLGRDVIELQMRLGRLPTRNIHHHSAPPPTTLLGRLQADIRSNTAPDGSAPADGTISIDACHGASRQVEVLRERLLGLLRDDPTLEPRDIIVMCPDIETFAPLIEANFGDELGAHPGHTLRVRLADRGLRAANPLMRLIATLLDLADGRVTANQTLDLASTSPVRTHFGFTDDDVETLTGWIQATEARWGLSEHQRARFNLGAFTRNTLESSLDRILLGVAADESQLSWLGDALPLDDVESDSIDLAGRFADFIETLDATLRNLARNQTRDDWAHHLTLALESLAAVPPSESWQLSQARREINALFTSELNTDKASTPLLQLSEARAAFADTIAPRPTRTSFCTGALTVCTMVPMRSVPHRVVALLGLDDEVFPRETVIDGDDILATRPCIGDRDPRSEDRQLLLDAVMSAQERLLLFYTGNSPVSGADHPPSIPLRELITAVELTTGQSSAVTRQSLQPFDPINFDGFSFDAANYAGAQSLSCTPAPQPSFVAQPLPPPPPSDIRVDELARFITDPITGFLKQRLSITLPRTADEISDTIPLELEPLDKWALGSRLIEAGMRGVPLQRAVQAERRRGSLPPLDLGDRVLEEVESNVAQLLSQRSPDVSRSVDVTIPVRNLTHDPTDTRILSGTITGVHGTTLETLTYSQSGGARRLTPWIELLALAVAHPDQNWTARIIERSHSRAATLGVCVTTLVPPTDPAEVLRQLIAIRDDGLTAPLPLTPRCAEQYARLRLCENASAEQAHAHVESTWYGRRFPGERENAAYTLVMSPDASYTALTAAPPAPSEKSWAADPCRFGALAMRIWAPVLNHQDEVDL